MPAVLTPGAKARGPVNVPGRLIKETAGRLARPGAARQRPSRVPRQAVPRFTGIMAAPLNELSAAEQRARDVGARRQADAKQYAAYVMGQQGSIQAAAVKQDQAAARAHQGIQTGTNAANMQLQSAMQAQRAAQGLDGPAPAQQLAGMVDVSQRTNTILGGMGQHLNTRADANKGRASFLREAARANLLANQRAIAGDEFNQVSDIRREKVGLLGQKEQIISAERQAAAQAAADVQEAQIAAEQKAADRASREAIAQGATGTRLAIAQAQLENSALQGRANRRVRLKTAQLGAKAQGYVSPADQRRRNTSVQQAEQARANAVSAIKTWQARYKAKGKTFTTQHAKMVLEEEVGKVPQAVLDYALAAGFGRKAGVTKRGQRSAARRYHDYINALKSGTISG